MKVFIFTKQRLLILGCCVLAAVLTVSIVTSSYTQVVNTAAVEKKTPIYCVDRGEEKVVSLSFDAAWGNEQTEGLLKTLEEYNVKTTFFLVGEWVEKYAESVKDIFDAGHDVGNHSDTHAHLPEMGKEQIIDDLNACNDKIEEITSVRPTLFRPPYGDYNNTLVEATDSMPMYNVQWDIDSLDWKDPSPQDMVDRIVKNLRPGSIILMHNGAKNTPEALPLIIEAIFDQGYEIVPISEILLDCEYETDHEGRMVESNGSTQTATGAGGEESTKADKETDQQVNQEVSGEGEIEADIEKETDDTDDNEKSVEKKIMEFVNQHIEDIEEKTK